MTVSIGASGVCAIDEQAAISAKSLWELADRCLYKSKKSRRNRATMSEAADATFELNWRAATRALARA
jgi:predicted signal transduction protein with EAL and GGDEF domain